MGTPMSWSIFVIAFHMFSSLSYVGSSAFESPCLLTKLTQSYPLAGQEEKKEGEEGRRRRRGREGEGEEGEGYR